MTVVKIQLKVRRLDMCKCCHTKVDSFVLLYSLCTFFKLFTVDVKSRLEGGMYTLPALC
jgi:hypothetical protein